MNQTAYHHILDSLITAVISVDTNLLIQHMNASAEMLLSASSEQMVGKPISQCFAPEDPTPAALLDALREERNCTTRRAVWRTHTHQELTVDYSLTPITESGHLIIEVQPLDRLLRISREEAKLSSQETSRNLVRSMAHEIKNPLGGIRGAAQLLARELPDEGLEEYTSIIIDETDRLRDLVDRMLGPHTLSERNAMNIHEVLEHVATVLKAECGREIRLVRDYDPSIPDMLADKSQLIQATLNITRNAMQALLENKDQLAERPSITFATRIHRRYTIGRIHHPLVVKVTITDNGPGIAPELIDDIFLPMITGRAEGTGLGLAISQNLIGLHQGLIECESEKGNTQFTLFLPLEQKHA
ncbi:nitrogen regulation protein NR(II) [Teredinibacter waterburyi]|uniref:nitrogen regulation protein NR(II) n=1 Tax=Teredinibacter waterburyi TaxID=1500538 RepID=UPI00165EEEEC|nr:nitrogen regulation protein NR(II) [Teredinibacter waterburyi]